MTWPARLWRAVRFRRAHISPIPRRNLARITAALTPAVDDYPPVAEQESL